MKKWIALCLLASKPLYAGLNDNHDFQVWLTESLRKSFGQLAFEIENEQRFGNCASELFQYYFQAMALYIPSPHLQLGAGYRYNNTRFFKSLPWRSSSEGLVDCVFTHTVENLTIANRSRFQYVAPQSDSNFWLYRNRFTFTLSHPFKCTLFQPIFTQEFFFRHGRGYSQNRIEIGLISLFGEDSSWSLLYMLRNLKRDEKWLLMHAARVKLNLRF